MLAWLFVLLFLAIVVTIVVQKYALKTETSDTVYQIEAAAAVLAAIVGIIVFATTSGEPEYPDQYE